MAERAPTVGGNRDRTRSVADYVRLWHGACNAYCRDGRHAGVIFSDHGPAGFARLIPGFVEGVLGLRYVGHQPAPEARDTGHCVEISEDGRVLGEDTLPMRTGYLVIWEGDELTRT
jgi:hypothetical protein